MLLLLISWVEGPLRGTDRPGEVQQFASGRTPRHLLRLAHRAEPIVERLDGRVMLRGAQGRHVQRGAQAPVAAALDLIRICGQLKLWDESRMEGVRNGQADAPTV